ncbi:hypothetical protein IQE94_08285 [Synechocystis sp. PCC 7339]|nr:hypothetical protein [Synechocystis sp. PCC 7339]UAJ74552.1 hypothetical protein IQE94_08285 [Synechocystis sp. PCC 7339]
MGLVDHNCSHLPDRSPFLPGLLGNCLWRGVIHRYFPSQGFGISTGKGLI